MAEGTEPKPIQDPVIRPYPKTDNVGTPLSTFISSLSEGVSYYYLGGATTVDGLPTTIVGDRIIKFYKYNVNLTDIIVFGASNKIVKGKYYVGTLSWSSAFPTYTYVSLGQVNTKNDLYNALKTVLTSVPVGEYINVRFTTGDSSTGIDTTIFTAYGYYTGTASRPYATYCTSIFTNQVGEIITLGYYAGSGSDVVTGWSSKKSGSF